jgi:methionine-rich copper-binding protein CopC
MHLKRIGVLGACALLSISWADRAPDRAGIVDAGIDSRRHLRLVKSEPAKDDTVASPAAVRLWFSLKPSLPLTRVKLTAPGGAELALGRPHADAKDARMIVAQLPSAIPAGTYTVTWKTASSDGHPINGDFSFVVAGK